ncbi:hypothetical protein CEUSTIGMA_g5590.t1 [Chlamydomonas eustigma]|uniref:Uncharacterized protein n=1 Tax=Chlamydomonas eustigma TaxID=1157962 RepID=A0A250X501_9CHLO|nr:hypothetical protein CEUSTIGMA_g5590.t1 [Chlamydomonas eustigma]|eukprot:GAX78148.1 hypothetical protein CEUSTIGMA_g5590.t1 [Chlamydomonas eustigma]
MNGVHLHVSNIGVPRFSSLRKPHLFSLKNAACKNKIPSVCIRTRDVILCEATSSDREASPAHDFVTRHRIRIIDEIVNAGQKLPSVGSRCSLEQIQDGIQQMQSLLPGPPTFVPNMDLMKGSDWAIVLLDPQATASKLVQLKMHFPGMNLSKVIAARPTLLLRSSIELEKDALGVKKLLTTAKNIDVLLETVPALMSPKTLLSAIVTVNKWYHLKRDPVEVLEQDPDIIRRAQDMDTPFEPVYEDGEGNYEAPQLNYREKRTDWQAYIDKKYYGQE